MSLTPQLGMVPPPWLRLQDRNLQAGKRDLRLAYLLCIEVGCWKEMLLSVFSATWKRSSVIFIKRLKAQLGNFHKTFGVLLVYHTLNYPKKSMIQRPLPPSWNWVPHYVTIYGLILRLIVCRSHHSPSIYGQQSQLLLYCASIFNLQCFTKPLVLILVVESK